jgi:hypothetical protein
MLAWLPLLFAFHVLTYQYGNDRVGANTRETHLTHADVNVIRFGKRVSYPVDGQIYGQPLYLARVNVSGKGMRNVVYAVTEHDSVYAFDADVTRIREPLWHVNFLNAARGVQAVPAADFQKCTAIQPEIGITGTPVIDRASGTLYVVVSTKETDMRGTRYVHRLHALDVENGRERRGSPVRIQASSPGTADGGKIVAFDPALQLQRAGLLLLDGAVYIAWSSHCNRPWTYHGWLIGYDAHTLKQTAVYNTTPNGGEASLWSSGAAPGADENGFIYVPTANGTYDLSAGGPDAGSSYLKLSTVRGLKLADYFTPFDYPRLNRHDQDLASSGVLLLPDSAGTRAHPHLLVTAGKSGDVYVLDRDNLGKVQHDPKTGAVQYLRRALWMFYGNPAYFNKTVYFCNTLRDLEAFPIAEGRLSAVPRSHSPERFSYPGCVPSVSANGMKDGIVWILTTSDSSGQFPGNAFGASSQAGVLRAYDATNVHRELYNSEQNHARDALGTYVKFSVPTVADGKVYAGTGRALVIYGLL